MLVGVASAADAAEAALLTTALSAPAEAEEVPEAEVRPPPPELLHAANAIPAAIALAETPASRRKRRGRGSELIMPGYPYFFVRGVSNCGDRSSRETKAPMAKTVSHVTRASGSSRVSPNRTVKVNT